MMNALMLLFALAAPQVGDTPPAGIYRAKPIESSPKLMVSGMVWHKDRLIFADRKEKRVASFLPPDRFETVAPAPAPFGVAIDSAGGVLVADRSETPRIVRLQGKELGKPLVEGAAANSPHFLAMHKSGTLFWSGFPDGGTRTLSPKGVPTVLMPGIGHTFGIAFSPKQDFLYVTSKLPDRAQRAVWRFPLEADGTAGKGELYFKTAYLEPKIDGLPEPKDGDRSLASWVGRVQGLAIDRLGNFYLGGAEAHTSGEAVAIVSADGKRVLGMILDVPRNISNLCFGGADGRTLFIGGAGEYRLFSVELPVAGSLFPGE